MITFRLSLITGICSIILFSCKKVDYQAPNNKRLYEVRHHWYDSISYTMLNYNQHGKLVEIKGTSNNQPLDTSILTISYDSENKMTGYTYTHNRSSWYASFKFLYDDAGRIIRKLYPNNLVSNSYSYDNRGRLVSDSGYSASENLFFPRGIFKYDNNNNVIEWQFSYYDSYLRRSYSQPVQQASHNNRINPYANLGLTLYFITYEDVDGLSKNNTVEVRDDRTSRKYEFEYYQNGLTQKIMRADERKVYQEFFYE